MIAQPIPGPYSLATAEPVVIDGVERAPAKIMRDNDGSLLVMAPGIGRIAAVHPTVEVRGRKRYLLTADEDPVQMATARLFVAGPAMASALKRIAEATPGSTNSRTMAEFQSWFQAVALTALDAAGLAEGR